MIHVPVLPGAACIDHDPELWFANPANGRRPKVGAAVTAAEAEAKAICSTCPIRTRCLQEALERDDQHGIWGGLTPNERKALT
mgnify:CR=1 FL=1